MKTTLKEIETKMNQEHKSGYVAIKYSENMAVRHSMIGYLKDIAKYYGISYENTPVEFIGYVGW